MKEILGHKGRKGIISSLKNIYTTVSFTASLGCVFAAAIKQPIFFIVPLIMGVVYGITAYYQQIGISRTNNEDVQKARKSNPSIFNKKFWQLIISREKKRNTWWITLEILTVGLVILIGLKSNTVISYLSITALLILTTRSMFKLRIFKRNIEGIQKMFI